MVERVQVNTITKETVVPNMKQPIMDASKVQAVFEALQYIASRDALQSIA